MRQGLVLLARPRFPEQEAIPIAQVPHPAHVTPADVDKDGRIDLVVSDLGAFFPGDHERGAVAILRARPGGGYAPFTVGSFPRVADVETGDFDGDGRVDLVVAAFGWFRTGEIVLLLNRTDDWSRPQFDRKVVDARPGAINVIPRDLDGDGKLDFVALLAQHFESVIAYLGDGRGGFRAQPLYAAPHPNWGSSGMELADLDGDSDLDVLLTNGDMFDDDILKPYHGLQWLENEGRLRFRPHPLAALPGAHRAVAADVDGDGDQDVVASAFTGIASAEITRRMYILNGRDQENGRGINVEGEEYTWDEYVLYNPFRGFRYLTEYNGHWNYVKSTPNRPAIMGNGDLYFKEQHFQHFQSAPATVDYVLGEFYWRVEYGESCRAQDFVAPPELLSVEQTDKEIAYSLGRYTEPEEIRQAFPLTTPLPPRIGVGGPPRRVERISRGIKCVSRSPWSSPISALSCAPAALK
jgi:hypothetical protein